MPNAFVLPLLALLTQAPPPNPACTLLTPAEAASLIGAAGKPMGLTAAPTGATCMVQNGDKIITVLQVKQTSPESAERLAASKKAIVSGTDLAGWPGKAYAGSLKDASAVGITKGSMFVEVRVTGMPATPELSGKLQAVMKTVAGRLP